VGELEDVVQDLPFLVVRWLARLVARRRRISSSSWTSSPSEGGFIPKSRRRPVAAWFNTQMAG